MTATTDTTESAPVSEAAPMRHSRPRRVRFGRRLLLVVTMAPVPSVPLGDLRSAFAADIRAWASHAEINATVEFITRDSDTRTETFLNRHAPNSVCVITEDSPHLSPAFVAEAFARLEHSALDTVYVPEDNGGYCLVGFKLSTVEQLQDVVWDHPEVLQIVLETAKNFGARAVSLPSWYRIQTDADLEKLRRDITRGTVTLPGTAAALGL